MTEFVPVGCAVKSDSEGDSTREWELLFSGASGGRGIELSAGLCPEAGVVLVLVAVVVMEIQFSVTVTGSCHY